MLTIFYTLVPVFGIMLLGAFAERRHLLPAETAKCLNQFVYWFSLPILLFHIMAQIQPQDVPWAVIVSGTLGFLGAQGIVLLLLRVLKVSWQESVMGGMIGSFPNVAFMGVPIILLLYPNNAEAQVAAGIMVVLPTINLIVTDIALTLQGTTDQKQSVQHGGGSLKKIWKGIYTNPSLIGASLGASAGIFEFSMPHAFMQMASMLGNTASPCALFCIGMFVAAQLSARRQAAGSQGAGQQRGKELKAQALMLTGKLFLCPMVMYVCCMALGVQGMSLAVMVILASMPTAVVCHILTSKHDTCTQACTTVILVGTMLSLCTVTLVIAMVQRFAQ